MINRIYVIESLRTEDKLTGKELYCDVIERYVSFYQKEIYHNYVSTESKNDFINKLDEILEETRSEDEIIIHIEAHGGNEEIQFGNDELLKWTELESYLIKINLKCKNKLHLNLATCYGMHVAEKITLKQTAPYKSYISALRELSSNEIIEDNSIFYKEIIETQDIFKSYIEFCKQKPETQLKIKDIETAMKIILGIQISRFANHWYFIKDFFDVYLNIQINNMCLSKLKTEDEIVEYVLNLFFDRYLPK
jgi:hypothetical protein